MNLRSVTAMLLALFLTFVVAEEGQYGFRIGRHRSSYYNYRDEDPDLKRPSRGSMVPFIRVGRSDSILQNEFSKRNRMNLIPLRIGRSEVNNWNNDDDYERKQLLFRRAPDNEAGLWFGPRMGRVHKRNIGEKGEIPWATIIINGIPIPSKYIYNSGATSEEIPTYEEKQKEESH